MADGANPNFTLPLHAKFAYPDLCNGYLPMDCSLGHQPVVNVPPREVVTVFLLVNNYSSIAGLQTAFQWDQGWEFLGGEWNCLPGQVNAVVPSSPGGPVAGTIRASFTCVIGPAIFSVGRMYFLTGDAGCVHQVASSYPHGIHAVDCQGFIDELDPNLGDNRFRLGRICIVQGGMDACWPIVPVEAATWGGIKATYQ